MITPKPLYPGARVALVAPSGPQPPERLEAALQSVRDLSFEPVLYESCSAQHGYLAGEDALRAADINAAFADDAIDGILCIRGGYGAHRLVPGIDFANIRRHPKLLCGYSDITALHIQLQQQCGLISWHTPMPGTEWYNGLDDYTMAGLRHALFGPVAMEYKAPEGTDLATLVPGTAEGQLVGGNLSLIAATLGTPYEIDTKGKILFIEDVDEEPYCIDRMLVQLGHAGKLADAVGILVGPFTNCVGSKEKVGLPLATILQELVVPYARPTLTGFACGHVLPTASLPLGAMAKLDATQKTFTTTGA